MTEKKLYVVAIIGVIICFIGDNLLGYFVPTSDFGNKLIQSGFGNAQAFTMDVFNTFILVGLLAAVGYAVMVIIIFIESIRGKVFPFKWMCVMNPFLIMIVCIVLSKILPQTAFVNGVFGLGQQSIGLFILFVTLYRTCN